MNDLWTHCRCTVVVRQALPLFVNIGLKGGEMDPAGGSFDSLRSLQPTQNSLLRTRCAASPMMLNGARQQLLEATAASLAATQ